MKAEQQVIEGLKALRMEIEAGMEEPEDQLLLLADVCQAISLSRSQAREIMGQQAWIWLQQLRGPSRELLEHVAAWPGVQLSPSWSQRLEAMRLAV